MAEGLTIMLTVFINLLYTHIMQNIYYSTFYMMEHPHLMAKYCLKVSKTFDFLTILRHETCQHVAVKYGGGTYNHAGSVHQLVIHLYNAKHPLDI